MPVAAASVPEMTNPRTRDDTIEAVRGAVPTHSGVQARLHTPAAVPNGQFAARHLSPATELVSPHGCTRSTDRSTSHVGVSPGGCVVEARTRPLDLVHVLVTPPQDGIDRVAQAAGPVVPDDAGRVTQTSRHAWRSRRGCGARLLGGGARPRDRWSGALHTCGQPAVVSARPPRAGRPRGALRLPHLLRRQGFGRLSNALRPEMLSPANMQ